MEIKQLTLFTKQLQTQRTFYHSTLGLPIKSEAPDAICFAIGRTGFTLKEWPEATPYHFAINIPANMEHLALSWLKERVGILRDGENEIQDFSSWNARSVYFYDPDMNILEFISRRNLKIPPRASFGPNCLFEVSEIGMAVDEIADYFIKLKEVAGLRQFDGDMEHFGAIGDEHGLFICINRLKKTWYPSGDKAYPSDFEMLFSNNGHSFLLSYKYLNLKITPLHE